MKGGIYRSGKSYVVRFGTLSKRFRNIGDAERFLTGVRFETDHHKYDARNYKKDNPLSFTNISEKWRKVKEKDVRPHSYRGICNHLARAQLWFLHKNVRDITPGDLEDFINEQGDISSKTKHNVMATLHSLFVWLKRRQEVQLIPEFPKVRYELGYRKTVDKELQQAIIEDIRQHEPFKVWLGIKMLSTYISIRPMELMNLTYQNMDLKNGYLYIPHPKEKKYKAVPIIAEDMSILDKLPRGMPGSFYFGEDGRRYGVNRFYSAWIRSCRRLGVQGVDLYGGTRHSSARALRKHYSPEEIKRATMHSSNAAFERYFTMESDDLRSIYQKSAEIVELNQVVTKL